MAFISDSICKEIAPEFVCLNDVTLAKASELGFSKRKFLFRCFFFTQDNRDINFFGDGIGTYGTYTLDVKDDHIFTMMKHIAKLKGLDINVLA